MKKVIKLFVAAFLLLGISKAYAFSIYSGPFSGSATSSWAYVTNPGTNIVKDNDYSGVSVNWQTSNQSSHRMWFRQVNSNQENKGSALLDYKTVKTFASTAEQNHYYWLQARRENIWDPATYVTGVWAF